MELFHRKDIYNWCSSKDGPFEPVQRLKSSSSYLVKLFNFSLDVIFVMAVSSLFLYSLSGRG